METEEDRKSLITGLVGKGKVFGNGYMFFLRKGVGVNDST